MDWEATLLPPAERSYADGIRGIQRPKGQPGRQWQKMAKWVAAGKWQEMDFRALCVVVIEVAKVDFGDLISYESQKSDVHKNSISEP